jgi:hypothetical protein
LLLPVRTLNGASALNELNHWYESFFTELLDEGGFTVIDRFADPDGTPFTVGAGRLLLVAERR